MNLNYAIFRSEPIMTIYDNEYEKEYDYEEYDDEIDKDDDMGMSL